VCELISVEMTSDMARRNRPRGGGTGAAGGLGFRIRSTRMNRVRSRFLILVGIVALVTPALGQQPSVASIVEQFYPPSLTAFRDEIGGRQQCFAVYDADASGAPQTIVAAYTNHTEAVIRVLRAGAGGFDVVAEPQAGLDLTGVWCDVILEDVDADGRKDIRVDFSVNRATVSWLFRWDGQQLWNLTPTTSTGATGYQMSSFVNGALVDVDIDGTKEIYVQPEYPRFPDEPVLPPLLYRLAGDQYVEDRPLVGIWPFVRETSTTQTDNVPVTLPRGARGPYTLRVVNGLPDGTARAASAQVWMNGREILSPRDLGNNVAVIERQVTLGAENQLAVRFAGQPSTSELLIIIESEKWGTR
jgi:hypothetical protein